MNYFTNGAPYVIARQCSTDTPETKDLFTNYDNRTARTARARETEGRKEGRKEGRRNKQKKSKISPECCCRRARYPFGCAPALSYTWMEMLIFISEAFHRMVPALRKSSFLTTRTSWIQSESAVLFQWHFPLSSLSLLSQSSLSV